jgi:carbamoyl-phosphate synthase large subunit
MTSNPKTPQRWLLSTVGKRNYIAHYLRESLPEGSLLIGTGSDAYTPGFAACDRAYVVPPISEPGYLDAVRDVCRRELISAILTLSDLDVPVISQIRQELTELGIACFFPGHETALRFVNKYKTYEYLRGHGFNTPETFGDLSQAIATLGFPLVIKPRDGSASQGFRVVRDQEEAELHWQGIAHPIAQQFIEGRLLNVESVSSSAGVPLGLSAWAKHSSVAGETLRAETIEHAEALALMTKLLELSPIPGPTDMDIIESGGELYILEVNTRFGGGYPTSHLAGADFAGAMVRSMWGDVPARLDSYQREVVMLKELKPFAYDASKVLTI